MLKSGHRKITVGLVLPYLKSRGTERQALRLAKGLADKGTTVVLFVVQGWGLENMYRAFRDAGAEIVNVGEPRTVGQKKINLSRVFSLAILARRCRCDVLLSRSRRSNQVCGWAGGLAGIPTILVLSGPSLPKKLLNDRFNRLVSAVRVCKNHGFPRHIVSVSQKGSVNFTTSYPGWLKRIQVIPNGVEVSSGEDKSAGRLAVNRQKFNICFCGSLEIHRKGMDLLLEALKTLVLEKRLYRVHLILIGTGQDETRIKNLVKEYGLADHVDFAGEQENPSSIIRQCDAFVLPSRQEGMPNALLEAMVLGICCISADCDTGPREIIQNEQNGILVPVGDAGKLAEAIALLEKDGDLRNRLAQCGLKTVLEKFSCQTMIDAYCQLITGII